MAAGLAEHGDAERGHVIGRQAAELHGLGIGEDLEELRALIIAVGGDEQQRQRAGFCAQLFEQCEALGGGPVDVFQQEQDRLCASGDKAS